MSWQSHKRKREGGRDGERETDRQREGERQTETDRQGNGRETVGGVERDKQAGRQTGERASERGELYLEKLTFDQTVSLEIMNI